MKRTLAILLVCLLLCGCGEVPPDPTAPSDFTVNDGEMFTDRDLRGDWEDPIPLNLEGSTATVTASGTYLLTGSLTGTLVISVGEQDKVQLVLSGVSIDAPDGPAIQCQSADKLFVTLAPDTENTLSSQNSDGLYSKCDLTLNGSGQLTVTAPAGHGITGKDDLAITGGDYHITCGSQAIDANDSVRICGGTFALNAGKDGIHAENADDAAKGYVYISGGAFQIEAQGDGISASSTLQVSAGSFELLCGGGYENGREHDSGGWGQPGGWPGGPGGPGGGRPRSTETADPDSTSMKGLKSGADMALLGGAFTVNSADDAFHSNTNLSVSGGDYNVQSGDDAFHAEETLLFTAGTVQVQTCYEGLEGKNVDIRGGDFRLSCDDDGINAAGGNDGSGFGGRDEMFGPPGGDSQSDCAITVSGGTLYISAGGDGLDSNGQLTISGGAVHVVTPKNGDTSVLDSDRSPMITGGTYVGLSITSHMAQTFDAASEQAVISCTLGTLPAGTELVLTDGDGREIFSATCEYSTVLLILSTPDLVKGQSYTLTAGDVSGTVTAK